MPDTRQQIAEYYDNLYAEGVQPAYPPEFTRHVVHNLCDRARVVHGARVLDVGCGTGLYSALLDERGYDVTGIDISETGIRKAKEYYPHIRFEVQDATALPYPRGHFDFIFAFGVSVANTHDLNAIRSWFEHLLSVTRTGGTVAFLGGSNLSGGSTETSDWINHSWNDIRSFVPRTLQDAQGPWLSHFRLMKSLPPALSMNGATTQALRFLPFSFERRIVLFLRK